MNDIPANTHHSIEPPEPQWPPEPQHPAIQQTPSTATLPADKEALRRELLRLIVRNEAQRQR